MNTTSTRRKEELQDEVLTSQKEITDLKIALQQSCDKQHEFEIEMRIAKARVDEAEREAAIAIGKVYCIFSRRFSSNHFEQEAILRISFSVIEEERCGCSTHIPIEFT